MMQVRVLGCGPSGGVPLVGGIWGKCDPTNPKNYRRRTSVLIQVDSCNILIDTSPDLRLQLLDAGIQHIDAVLYTHDHADHTHGIDDLRPFFIGGRQETPIPIYGECTTIEKLESRFSYLFGHLPEDVCRSDTSGKVKSVYPTVLASHVIDVTPFNVLGLSIQTFTQNHGFSRSLGYRFSNFAYSTDVVELDETAFRHLEGLDVWFVDCLNEEPRRTHAHLDLTLSWIERVRPKRAILIHMDQSLDYETLRRGLPPGVEPAYDGMVVTL